MNGTKRTRPPDSRWTRDLEARFAALWHLRRHGLASELVEHALFSPAGWCVCSRCRYFENRDDHR